jgi:hypothetical protein
METSQSEREEYLAKAKWAEEMAAQMPESFYRESWFFIARGYRDLIKKLDAGDQFREAGS